MEQLRDFELFLAREKGLLASTIYTDLKIMKRILRVCSPLCRKTFEEMVVSLIDDQRNITYINKHINLVRYYGECFHKPSLANFPYCKLRQRKEFVRSIFSDQEIEDFLNLPNPFKKKTAYYKRYEMWTLYWYINAYEGLRPGETIRLRVSDIDLGRNVFIVHGKTGVRVVPISFVLRKRLQKHLANLTGEVLFPPLHSGKTFMTSTAWLNDFRQRLKRLGIARPHLDPYSFRHSFGTRLAEEDVSLPKIQLAMGHRKLETTQKYLHMSLKGVEIMIENDRLSLPYKHGAELIKRFLDDLMALQTVYRDKLLVSSLVKEKRGRRVCITLEAID